MDLIEQIYPSFLKGHEFIIVATDYFTKYVELVPMRSINQLSVIDFIRKNIIHRFSLPETIITDQGSIIMRQYMSNFS